jgi:hypothetical protein
MEFPVGKFAGGAKVANTMVKTIDPLSTDHWLMSFSNFIQGASSVGVSFMAYEQCCKYMTNS